MGKWSDNEVRSMKESVSILMEASGEQVSTNDNKKSLPQLLQAFVVGTERQKIWKEKSKVQAKPSTTGRVNIALRRGTGNSMSTTCLENKPYCFECHPKINDGNTTISIILELYENMRSHEGSWM